MKDFQGTFSKLRRNPFDRAQGKRLQSRDEVGQKADQVAVPFVQRQPGGGPSAIGDPFADQRGFPEAGRGRDEGHAWRAAGGETLVEPLDQARTDDYFSRRWRDIELRA